MRTTTYYLSLCLAALLAACTQRSSDTPRERHPFNTDWKFFLGDSEDAMLPAFDDSQWRTLDLPHDWSVEGDFSRDNPAGTGGGALPGGIGWYRKTFIPEWPEGKQVYIDFDGIYMDSEVYLNGRLLGHRPYGYISFRYDLTPYLKFKQPNVLAVKVNNSEQPNSRWYSGSGIYRNVWLTATEPVHVDVWGTYVTTPKVTSAEAALQVVTRIRNREKADAEVNVVSVLLDADGRAVTQTATPTRLPKDSIGEITQTLQVDRPVLWSVENPYMYTLRTEIYKEGKLTDRYDTPTGIRSFRFDAEKGFFLNDQPVKIKGVCMHHDLGALGAAFHTRAAERQLEILKEMGCNGIRCTHNPPAPELLDLCDRMGFIVMDEAFDMWRKRKTKYDYSRYFNEWHERDLTDLIIRDRNHPSIFMWSIGNEVLEQWTHADADTLDLQAANLLLNLQRDKKALTQEPEEMSVNSLLTKKLADLARALDPTRPVTAGNNEPDPSNHLFRSGALDIIGYNYHETWFKDVPRNFPGKPFIITESTSGLMTRGYYRMPSDSVYLWPSRWDIPFEDSSFACSSYDNCHVPWGTTHEESWRLTKQYDFISGLYVWTGFDYLGEPTPYGWPARSSFFGIVDLAGFPKDVYYMYQSEWTDRPVLHLFPHWNWKEGQTVDVWAYYNQADEVELFLNGRSQGVRKKEGDALHVSWRLTFEPGTIRAVSRKNGKEVMTKEIHTAAEPAGIRLTADRKAIRADGSDLSFVTVEVVDKAGNLCPTAANRIGFTVEGAGFIAGVDNGNPVSLERFKASERKAFYGKCLVILRNNGESGSMKLTASSDGLSDTSILINTK